jgi:predicted nucleic acid-binding protein
MQTITQRELRNDSGAIMRRLDHGETFIVTRNGTPVGELTPMRRHRFVSTDPENLPIESAVSAITMAELAAGPHATQDPDERARRQDRLQRAEAVFDPLPFDSEASRAYGRVYAAVVAAGRKARGARAVDLLIAATACSARLPLYTRNLDDLEALHELVDVVHV